MKEMRRVNKIYKWNVVFEDGKCYVEGFVAKSKGIKPTLTRIDLDSIERSWLSKDTLSFIFENQVYECELRYINLKDIGNRMESNSLDDVEKSAIANALIAIERIHCITNLGKGVYPDDELVLRILELSEAGAREMELAERMGYLVRRTN